MDSTIADHSPAYHIIRRFPSLLLACIKEARPTVLGIQLIRFTAGAAMAAQITGHWLLFRTGIGALSWELAICWTYLLNGVMDIQEDRVNGSRRPIASGLLAPSAAARCAVGAAVLSVICAGMLGIAITCTVLAMLVIGWQYSASPCILKRGSAGTAAAGAALGFLAYLAGFLSQARTVPAHPGSVPLIFALTMSAWMAFVGTPAKDLPDTQGDAAAGRRSLALIWGEIATRRLLVVSAVTITIVFSLAAVFGPPLLRWPAVALGIGASAITLASLSQISTGDRSRRRLPYRIFMLTQYAVNLCLLAAML
jgi:4-hydroxybenzoate polyprenyltransferase